MHSGFTDTLVGKIGSHLKFEYDPSSCQKSGSKPFDRRDNVTVSDVDNMKYLQIFHDKYSRPKFDPSNTEGIVEYTDPSYADDGINDDYEYVDPDAARDTDMHGLIIGSHGHLVLYPNYMPDLYSYKITSGLEGTVAAYKAIGRNPGQDILMPVPNENEQGFNSAGVITRQLADMQMLFPSVTDFYMANHDFGSGWVDHGLSWPHTHPELFKHLSRKAQEAVILYGTQLDYDEHDNDAYKPPEALEVAYALDGLSTRLVSTADGLSAAELRIRDGRYDEIGDIELSEMLLNMILGNCNVQQTHAARQLMAIPVESSQSERSRVGHWVSFQLASGVLATRQVLHEVAPHPEANASATKRTLNVYNTLQKEMQRRLDDNCDVILKS